MVGDALAWVVCSDGVSDVEALHIFDSQGRAGDIILHLVPPSSTTGRLKLWGKGISTGVFNGPDAGNT